MSDDRPEPMAVASHGPEAPKTHDEARFFHDGFIAGVTAYAGAVGHSQLKSDNDTLRRLFDEQGWQTIETFEKLSEAVLVCEHGVKDGDWCEPCNREYKRAAAICERCDRPLVQGQPCPDCEPKEKP